MNIDTNGAVLSYRYIVDRHSEPITADDVASIRLSVFHRVMGMGTLYGREVVTGWNSIVLPVSDVISSVERTPGGHTYNFTYCVEGAFTTPNTVYIVEYILTMADGHTKPIVILVKTGD